MENKLNSNETSQLNKSQITFIDRKKSKPLFDIGLKEIKLMALSENFKNEKTLFRLLYDKIYRPELYELIMKGGDKNINFIRRYLGSTNEKHPFVLLKNNDPLDIEDEESNIENNYLLKSHKIFIYKKSCIYLLMTCSIVNLYYRFIKNSIPKFKISLLAIIFFTILHFKFTNDQIKLDSSSNTKEIQSNNEKMLLIYKNLYKE